MGEEPGKPATTWWKEEKGKKPISLTDVVPACSSKHLPNQCGAGSSHAAIEEVFTEEEFGNHNLLRLDPYRFEINNSVEDCDNSDDGGKSEDSSCNTKEEERGDDFSEKDDKNLSHNEDEEEDEGEGTFETKIEVEYHGVQNDDMTGKKKSFKCNVCPKQYQTKESLFYHKKYTHRKDGLEKFKCGKCDYKTMDNSNLKKHLKIHDKSKYFKYHFCEYIAAELKCLDSHLLNKHKSEIKENKIKIASKIYQCPKCKLLTVIKSNHD
ncbi:unnamed protein product [Brassicogethes aeneus]|uniref:C2H2-type domain-containing protein n=1 Tax=Brassicogethes aeneus TaxID=1431903 RepID=A0A9P0FEH1_BRAAE|nr:unnamed protein product [Brassicogethes aeneus]